jgi:uncharacterized membrane protein
MIAEEALSCAQLDLSDACSSTYSAVGACSDDSFIPWNRLFLCGGQNLDILGFIAFTLILLLMSTIVMWIGVNLLSKVSPPCVNAAKECVS